MRDLKLLPWRPLLNVAGVTVAIATLIDGILALLVQRWSVAQSIFGSISAIGSILITSAVVSFGVGVLGVVILERWPYPMRITGGILWALIGCLALLLWFRTLFPIPGLFFNTQLGISLAGLLIGVFGKGMRYWRWR